jgi:hypothetical protein
MSKSSVHDFGIVDVGDDFFELHWQTGENNRCRLESIIQTERGPRRNELVEIPSTVWDVVSARVIRELVGGMGETERTKKAPSFKPGTNRLSPLLGRELAILFWALMEAEGEGNTEAILHGWRELAREERWWLYAKAAAPGQRSGAGWRLALFHGLSQTPDSRVAEPTIPICREKKSLGNGSSTSERLAAKKNTRKKQRPSRQKSSCKLKEQASSKKMKSAIKPQSSEKGKKKKKRPERKNAKKTVRKKALNSSSFSEMVCAYDQTLST